MPEPAAKFIGDVPIHPAADVFPLMDGDEFAELCESIQKHGIRQPVIYCDGMLLDGRNRVRAARLSGIATANIPSVNIGDDVDPFEFAWSQNCERLNYAPGLKAEIRVKILAASEAFRVERTRAAEEANRRRSEKQKGIPKSVKAEERLPPDGGTRSDPRKNSAAAKLAKAAGVSQRTVERALAKARAPREGPGLPRRNRSPSTWRVPSDVKDLAAFLRRKLTSAARKQLVTLLSGD